MADVQRNRPRGAAFRGDDATLAAVSFACGCDRHEALVRELVFAWPHLESIYPTAEEGEITTTLLRADEMKAHSHHEAASLPASRFARLRLGRMVFLLVTDHHCSDVTPECGTESRQIHVHEQERDEAVGHEHMDSVDESNSSDCIDE